MRGLGVAWRNLLLWGVRTMNSLDLQLRLSFQSVHQVGPMEGFQSVFRVLGARTRQKKRPNEQAATTHAETFANQQ